VFAAPDDATGECGVGLAGLGEACGYWNGTPTCSEGYPKRTTDAEGLENGCECAPFEAVGGPCRADVECESYACAGEDPDDPTVLGTCDPFTAVGGACAYPYSCESGYCESGYCAEPPVCS
jgi:hypothetical protein